MSNSGKTPNEEEKSPLPTQQPAHTVSRHEVPEYPTEENFGSDSSPNNLEKAKNSAKNSKGGSREEESQVSESDDSDGSELPLNPDAPVPPPPPRDFLIGPALFIIMSLVAVVFTAVSVGIPWYRVRQYKPLITGGRSYVGKFYLFKHTYQEEGMPKVTTHPSDYCHKVRTRVKVIEAFSIISSAMAFIMFVLSIVNFVVVRSHKAVKIAMLVFAGATMASLTIEVSFNFNVYVWSFTGCPQVSYHSQLYEPYVGFGLTVTAWVLTGFGGIIAANHLYVSLDARAVDKSIHAFTCVALIAFLFSVVSCPIPHWFYKNIDDSRVTDVLLWRERYGNFDWDYTLVKNRTSLFVKNMGCKSIQRYFRAAEAFNIISIFVTACAGGTGLLLWKDLMGTRLPAVIFTYIGTVTTLIQMALELKIFYGKWCSEKYAYHKKYYELTAGFALVASSFCAMAVACFFVTIAYVLTERYFPSKEPKRTMKQVIVEEAQ